MWKSEPRGFSLIELVVALSIIALAFTVLFSSVSTNLRNIRRLDDYERRVQQARSKLAELELLPGFRPGDRSEGTFDDGTRWRIDVRSFLDASPELAASSAPAMVHLVMTLEWNGRRGPQSWTVDTYRMNPPGLQLRSLEEQLSGLR
jgi:general secretion pathway protein I